MVIRSIQEIKDYYASKKEEPFSFAGDVLEALPFDEAKEFFKEEFIEKVQTGEAKHISTQDFEKIIRDYLSFAWGKANDCRGISANCSIAHFLNWFWLINDEFYQKLQKSYEDHYQCYGKPQLVMICEYLGVDWKQYDDGKWVNKEEGESLVIEEVLEACRRDKTEEEKFRDKIDGQLELARLLTQNGEVTDYKKQLAKLLYSSCDSFDGLIFVLHHKAQSTKENLQKLKKGFPEHFELWNEWFYCKDADAFFKKYGVK